MAEGSAFMEIYPEQDASLLPAEQIRKVIICNGQVYYDLLNHRTEKKLKDVAIVRVEQLCPFPYEQLKKVLAGYKNAQFLFAQEEHQNYGSWYYCRPRISCLLKQLLAEKKVLNEKLLLASRKPSSSPATGSGKTHEKELHKLITVSFQ